MYFAGPPIWLLFAPVYLLAVIVVAVIWAIKTVRSRTRPNDLPSCRRCGYAVVGLDRGVCPECGSHLTDAHAIVRPDTIGIRTAIKRLTLFTLLASYPAVVAAILMAELSIWPNLCGTSVNAVLSQPTSQAFDAAQIHVGLDDAQHGHSDGIATLQIDRWPRSPRVTIPSRTWQIELSTMRWRGHQPRNPLPWSAQPIDADVLAGLIADRSFTGDPQALVVEAQCILSTIDAVAKQAKDGSTAVHRASAPAPFPQVIFGSTVVNSPSSAVPFGQAITGITMVYCENPKWVAWVIGAVELFTWLLASTLIWIGARRQALRNRLALQQAIASTNSQGLPS